jgi:hypothetical protein
VITSGVLDGARARAPFCCLSAVHEQGMIFRRTMYKEQSIDVEVRVKIDGLSLLFLSLYTFEV